MESNIEKLLGTKGYLYNWVHIMDRRPSMKYHWSGFGSMSCFHFVIEPGTLYSRHHSLLQLAVL